ncbi:protocadherin Fat 3-like [Silurus asotus]|uniref:Protocadherin Fat 3-like n=1 Tax=Silurus asotus TaxID=30991 RepID=A0AAD5B1D1_SILAS|nr:protocadherin Fat 3-like [Silurus asotus]
MNLFRSELLLILACVCVHAVQAAIGTSEINCASGNNQNVGSTSEGFEGDVESLTNISPGDSLQLEGYPFPIGKDFLELVHVPGETTGTIRTTKPLDADALTEIRNRRTLVIYDINDNAPVFEQKVYTATVSEIERVQFQVLKVRAVDADVSPENNRVTYSILDPAPAEFEVWNDGTVRLRSRLNYNTASFYNFTVKAVDVGNLYDTATVTINVQDFDNLNPYFDHALYQAFIPENQVGPFRAVMPENIKAQDGDMGINQTVVYNKITVTPNKYQPNFSIDENNGIISVTPALDREEIESITLLIQAAQQDDSAKIANAIVLVTVEDVDDNAPEFDQSNYTAVIPENSPRDHFILQAKVTDQDQGGFVGTLRLVPDTVPFSIDPDGAIRVKTSSELDRETIQEFAFTIEAREKPPSNHSTMASVNIMLSDENDNSPVFGSAKYEGKVSTDQTVGMLVVKVGATDLDEGLNGQIRYFIEFGNDEGYFSINENTGEITLNKTIPLLENTILQFLLFVTAIDGGSVSQSASALVDIKAPGDSRPQFLQKSYEGKVEEEQEAGAEIVKVTFLSVSPATPVILTVETEADKFSVDQLTGTLTTKVKLDHEVQKNYTVLVSISDGVNRDEATVYVDVLDINDNSPKFPSSSFSVIIPEDAGIGSSVTNVEATDADSGLNAEIRYSLEGTAGMFAVNPETGFIVVTAELDRETKHEYNLTMVAQDQGRPSLSATASVVVTVTDVNDNPPIFSKQRYEASVFENATGGTHLIVVNATDKDEGPNAEVSYHIAKQEPPSSPAAFSIDATLGIISVAQKLDYSKVKKYSLEVEARDGGSLSLTGSAVVVVLVEDVNDKPPKFSKDQYDVAVYENIAPGSPLVSLEVTDENEGGFSNGHFLLTSDDFSINNEGVVHLRSNSSLDRETRDNYIVEVVAVDQPVSGLSATAQINITVLDVNDNNPQFSKFQNPITIPEDKTGEVVKIEDGTLIVIGTLDREKQEVYSLVLVASDYGTPQRHNITTLKVIVTDVNDNAPVFSQPSYSTRVLAKDVKKGDLVLTVSATDQDVGNNSLITYRLSKDSDIVDLNPVTGAMTWTSDLTHLTEDTLIDLIIIAEDHGTPSLNDTATVTIDVRGIHLMDTIFFENATYVFSVKENEPAETNVGGVRALTGNQLIQVTYSLMSHTELFSVDKSGAIKTLKSLNKEEKETYIINVEAIDSRTPPNTAKTTVVIEVEDVNETPVFEQERYTAEIYSIAPFRYPVVTVKALDPDVWDSEGLQYSLEDSSSLLGIESNSGQVYVLDLAGTGGKTITAHVKATDKHGLSASAEIQASLKEQTFSAQIQVKDSTSENIVVITLNQPAHTVQMKMTETQKSLEKVLGWSVHVLSVREEHGNEMRSRVSKIKTKTYISFIAVDAAGETISAKKVHEKLQSESESVKVELEKVFGSNVELEGVEQESKKQENQDETAVIVLGVMLALSLVALITLTVVAGIKYKKMKKNDSDQESFNIGKPESCSVSLTIGFDVFRSFTNAELLRDQQEDLQNWNSSRKASEASQKRSVAVPSSDNDPDPDPTTNFTSEI